MLTFGASAHTVRCAIKTKWENKHTIDEDTNSPAEISTHQINAVIYITLSLYYNNYYPLWSILQAINCSTDIITHGLCFATVTPHMYLHSNDACRTRKTQPLYYISHFNKLVNESKQCNYQFRGAIALHSLKKIKLLQLNMSYSHNLSTIQLKPSQTLKGQLLGQITVRNEQKLLSKCCWICLKPQELPH